MDASLLTHVVVDLTDRPRFGRAAVLLRCRAEDMELIDRVAHQIGMTKADFIRTVVIKAARKLEEEIENVQVKTKGRDGKAS